MAPTTNLISKIMEGEKKFLKGFVVIFWGFFLQQTEWERQKCWGLRPGRTKLTLESTNLSAQVVFSAYSLPRIHPFWPSWNNSRENTDSLKGIFNCQGKRELTWKYFLIFAYTIDVLFLKIMEGEKILKRLCSRPLNFLDLKLGSRLET